MWLVKQPGLVTKKTYFNITVNQTGDSCINCHDITFEIPAAACKSKPATFINRSICIGSPTYSWNYGDGTPETSLSEHIYSSAGTYNVTLRVNETGQFTSKQIIVTESCPVACGGSIELNTQNASVQLPDSTNYITTSAFTWECWFKLNAPLTQNTMQTRAFINTTNDECGEEIALGLGWKTPSIMDNIIFNIDPANNCSPNGILLKYKMDENFVVGEWHYVAAVMNYEKDSAKLYVNGRLVDSIETQISPINISNLHTELGWNALLGNKLVASAPEVSLDEVRFWALERNKKELDTCMGKPLRGDEPGLVAYYNFNRLANNNVIDDISLGGTNDAITANGAVLSGDEPLPFTSLKIARGGRFDYTYILDSGEIEQPCSGQQIVLAATGADRYVWSTADTAEIITTPKLYTNTKFIVTGYINDYPNCTKQAEYYAEVGQRPTITVNSGVICKGDSITLTGIGGDVYYWVGLNDLNSSIKVSPDTTTTFYVQGWQIIPAEPGDSLGEGVGCPGFDTAVVTVSEVPVSLSYPAEICKGQSAQLEVVSPNNNSYSYYWKRTGEITKSIVVNFSADSLTRHYDTVIVTDINGCSKELAENVFVKQIPQPEIFAPVICFGNQAVLSASGADSYHWSNGTIVSDSSVIFTEVITSATTPNKEYILTTHLDNGCSSVDTAIITVEVPNVSVVAIPKDTICKNTSITLYGVGAKNYYWESPNNITIYDSTAFYPDSTATYTLTASTENGCEQKIEKTIVVIQGPNATAVSDTACMGALTTIRAQGGIYYQWSANAGNATTDTVKVLATTIDDSYSVLVTDAYGCAKEVVATILLNEPEELTIFPSLNEICSGDTAVITARGALSYTWTSTSGAIINIDSMLSVTPLVSTDYLLKGTDACSNVNTLLVNVGVNSKPTLLVDSDVQGNEICIGQSVAFYATGADSLTWSPPLGLSTTKGPMVIASPNVTTNYTLSGTSTCGIKDSLVIKVRVNEEPELTIVAEDTVICIGEEVKITAGVGSVYSWSPSNSLSNDNSAIVFASPTDTTKYTVVASSVCGVTSEQSITIHVRPFHGISVSPTSAIICKGDLVKITAAGSPTYTWKNAIGLDVDTGSTVIASPMVSTTYTLTGDLNNGCSNIRKVDVIVDCPIEILGCSFSNYGASVLVNQNTHINDHCNLVNEIGGVVNSALQRGDFENNNQINVLLDWVHNAKNDLYLSPRTGLTSLFGANQKMMGNSNTHFYQLDLDGIGTKTILIDEYNEFLLKLNGNQLATENNIFFVQNSDPNSITGSALSTDNQGGFVSSDGIGYLARTMDVGSSYLFPMGSKRINNRYRPVIIQNLQFADMVKVGFTNSPPVAYDKNKLAPNVKVLNPLYYHRINNTNPLSSNKEIKTYYQPGDGLYQSIAHWEKDTNPNGSQDYWWGSTEGANVNLTPDANGLVYALTNGEQTFDDIPYILANSGFYIKTTEFGVPQSPQLPEDPDNPGVIKLSPGTTITVKSPKPPGSPLGGLGEANATGPNGGTIPGGPTVFTPSPIQGEYEMEISPANGCGVPGKISFTINNKGLIDPSSVKYFTMDSITARGLLTPDVYEIDNYNTGIVVRSTPKTLLDSCVNSMKVSFGENKDFVFDKPSLEQTIEVVIPKLDAITVGALSINSVDGTTQYATTSQALLKGTNTINFWNDFTWTATNEFGQTINATGMLSGTYEFKIDLTISGVVKTVKGQFIINQ